MTNLLAVEALYHSAVRVLLKLLRALSLGMAHCITVAALRNASIHWNTSIFEPLHVLFGSSRESVLFLRA